MSKTKFPEKGRAASNQLTAQKHKTKTNNIECRIDADFVNGEFELAGEVPTFQHLSAEVSK